MEILTIEVDFGDYVFVIIAIMERRRQPQRNT